TAKPAKKVAAKAKPARKAPTAKPAKKVAAKAKLARKAPTAKPAKKVAAKAKLARKAPTAKPAKKVAAKAKLAKKAPTAKPSRKAPATRRVTRTIAKKASTSAPALAPHKPGKWEIDTAGKKFFIANVQGDFQKGENDGLPQAYGETRIVALSRNPRQIYVYWEIRSEDAETARKALGADWAKIGWIIRLFDITGPPFKEENTDGWVDINIGSYERDRYIDLDRPGRKYIAVIGLIGPKLVFQAIAQSDVVLAASGGAHESAIGEWAVSDDKFAKLYALSGGGEAGESSGGGFGDVSSGSGLGFGASEESARKKDRRFFFRLDCELTVRGATDPDAQVTMMGSDIALNRDGTFSARFALPDGTHDIPVVAISPDKMERWEISPTVSRKTRVSRGQSYNDRAGA
ncbi:Ku domain protein, partial [hydrothermal vent metagenome]